MISCCYLCRLPRHPDGGAGTLRHAVVRNPSSPATRQKSFEEAVRGNIFVWFAGVLATGFVAGVTSYEFFVRSSGQTRVPSAQLKELQDDQTAKARNIVELNTEIRAARDQTQRLTQQLRSVHDKELIIKLFGDNYWAYRTFDLKKEIGADLSFGQCGSTACFKLRYLGTKKDKDNDKEWVEMELLGPGLKASEAKINIPASKAAKLGVQTAIVDYLIIVEDDRINSFRLGVGLREGTSDPEGIPGISFGGLRDDAVPTRKQLGDFYAKWGVSGDLPFNENADATKDFEAALEKARAHNKLVLVQFGANWKPDCLVMHNILKSDDVGAVRSKSFELVSVDVGRFTKNRNLWRVIAESIKGDSFPIPFF
jgi:hypothetical protein